MLQARVDSGTMPVFDTVEIKVQPLVKEAEALDGAGKAVDSRNDTATEAVDSDPAGEDGGEGDEAKADVEGAGGDVSLLEQKEVELETEEELARQVWLKALHSVRSSPMNPAEEACDGSRSRIITARALTFK